MTLKQQLEDSLRMAEAKTPAELSAACADIEARMERDGVTDIDRRLYQVVKEREARRVG